VHKSCKLKTIVNPIAGFIHACISKHPNIVRVIKSRRMRWAGHVARMGEGIVVYIVLMSKPERTWPPGRPIRRRDDKIKIDLQKVGWGYGLD
jgi:hypothetical protein